MKKIRKPLLIFLALGVIVLCYKGCNMIRVYREMTAGDASPVSVPDTIPFAYRNNKIIIKGKVNGQEYDFVLDTGAPTVIWEEVAGSLQLPKSKASITSTDANGTKQKLEFYRAEKVTVGAFTIENLNLASIRALSDELKCYANGGIIGGNFLMHYNWQIDYAHKRLIGSSDLTRLKIPGDAIRVEAIVSKPQGQVIIDNVQLAGQTRTFILDTGNGGYFNLGMDEWNPEESGEKTKYVEGYGYSNLSTGGRKIITTNTIQADLITPMDTIRDAIVHVDTKSSLIGNAYLSQFGSITIDYTSKEQAVYFNREKTNAADGMTFGFTPVFRKETNSFVVGKMYKHSGAEKLGLQVNDEILAINGKDLTRMDYAAYCGKHYAGEPLYPAEGNTMALTVLRDGRKIDFQLKKYPLFQ